MSELADNPTDPQPPAKDGPQHRVARNFLFSLFGMVVATPLNIIGMLIMARRLGKESVGVCFSVFAMVVVVYLVTSAGVATVLTRRVARDLKNARRHVGEAAGVLLVLSAAAFPLLLVLGSAWSAAKGLPMRWDLFLLAGVAVAGRHAMEFAIGAMRGLERFEFETLIRFLQNGGFCLLVLATVTPEAGPISAVAAFAASHFLAVAVATGVLVIGFGCRQFHLRVETVRDWVRESWPLGWGDSIRGMGWHVDTIMLSLLGTNAAVGIYNVAYRPLMPLRAVPRTLASATFPMMSRLQGDIAKMSQAFSRSINVLWFASLPICIAITGCAYHIIVLLTTEEFVEAVAPLRALIWVTTALFITTQYRFLFTALGEQRTYSRMVTATLALKVGLLAALIPAYTVWGAVAGTIAAEIALLALGLAACRQFGMAFLPWRRMLRAVPPALVMAGLIWAASDLTWPWLFAVTAASGVVYVGLCLLCGVFDASELDRMRRMLRRRVAKTAAAAAPAPPAPAETPQKAPAASLTSD